METTISEPLLERLRRRHLRSRPVPRVDSADLADAGAAMRLQSVGDGSRVVYGADGAAILVPETPTPTPVASPVTTRCPATGIPCSRGCHLSVVGYCHREANPR